MPHLHQSRRHGIRPDQRSIMTRAPRMILPVLLPVLMLSFIAGCEREQRVSFANDVKPILAEHCFECHLSGGTGVDASGFSMSTYEDLMRGTTHGPMIIPGDALGSNLLVLMEGRADPSIRMPHNQLEGADPAEIDTIRRWIEQGAPNN